LAGCNWREALDATAINAYRIASRIANRTAAGEKITMQKIHTIFDRDWQGDRGVVNKYVDGFTPALLDGATATEKIDGTNVRLTIRNHTLVRLEKRRNPDRIQKQKGIEEPWYVDASEYDPQDKHIWDAARHTDLTDVPDGEWSGEALGKDIQGNPLKMAGNTVVLFSLGRAPVFENVPVDFDQLKSWLPLQNSKYGTEAIEGIVWHCPNGDMYKIKVKDFK
jgi:Family of unknown function (DUF5565)